MKIAIIGSTNFDSLEFHLHDELIIQGHNSKIFDFASFLPKKVTYGLTQASVKYNVYRNNSLLQKILNYDPDLVIGVYRNISPELVKEVKNRSIKIIHLNPDALTTFKNQQLFVEPYDAYFSKDKCIVNFMKDKLQFNVFHYNEAFNPRFHTSESSDYMELEQKFETDVLCFGNLYPYRNRMLTLLKDKGLDLTLYGHKARFFDEKLEDDYKGMGIYGETKKQILNGAKIVFNNFHYAEIESVNNKFFEINGSGAFQICDYKPILNELLPLDPNRVSFTNIDEAGKLIKYYLKNDKERWEIRDEIKSHFMENYTYRNLINHVFSCI